ncbi:hypothetical protein BU24DRAFT_474509 [Aaosphaeria arxii CBS 175.79]|uniref:Wax synthase domain-containing protein n=1 Tax=Aaosphaeria arxii CBS 175.79 TaxID=1450172 RepID=A0A6A5X7X2_9PLEO|nr:uncharacterized protein BU24DRAFT_474509 [Aaosphaeria arxii CBS 175.79]KAF2009043.1 hypothetical protein BU24DRAFT_474509 [Aaosphaeria arxii CBS 175.79]
MVHPIFLFLVSFTTNVFVLSFTTPQSLFRLACFLIPIFNVWYMLYSQNTVTFSHPMYANLLGGSIFTFALQYFNLVILRKSCYEQGGPTRTPEGATLQSNQNDKKVNDKIKPVGHTKWLPTATKRLSWGTAHIFDSRGSGNPWEVKNVPRFSTNDPHYIPTKNEFLIRNILICLSSTILLDIVRPSADSSQNEKLFADHKIYFFSRLGSVTVEEISIRFLTTLASTVMTYLLFQAMYSAGAVVMVGLGMSRPDRWRPLFGDIREVYSLRRSWSIFWHQGLTSNITAPAKYFTFKIFGLRKGSILARYVFTIITFALSGAMHTCGELAAGITPAESGTIQFFTTQALGIVIEDIFSWAWKRFNGNSEPRWYQKVMGFAWVVLWFTWSMPVWTYPASKRSQGESILPFSIIDHF